MLGAESCMYFPLAARPGSSRRETVGGAAGALA